MSEQATRKIPKSATGKHRRRPRRRGYAKVNVPTLIALQDITVPTSNGKQRLVSASSQANVLTAICAYQHFDAALNRTADKSTATLDELGKIAHLERKTIERAIKALEIQGVITRESGAGGTITWALNDGAASTNDVVPEAPPVDDDMVPEAPPAADSPLTPRRSSQGKPEGSTPPDHPNDRVPANQAAAAPLRGERGGAARRAAAAQPQTSKAEKVKKQILKDLKGATAEEGEQFSVEGHEVEWWVIGAGRVWDSLHCTLWLVRDPDGNLGGTFELHNLRVSWMDLIESCAAQEITDWMTVLLACYERQREPYSIDSIPKLVGMMAKDVRQGSRPKSMFGRDWRLSFTAPRVVRDDDVNLFDDDEEEEERHEAVRISEDILADLG